MLVFVTLYVNKNSVHLMYTEIWQSQQKNLLETSGRGNMQLLLYPDFAWYVSQNNWWPFSRVWTQGRIQPVSLGGRGAISVTAGSQVS